MRYRITRTKAVRDTKEVAIYVGRGMADNAQALDEAIRNCAAWEQLGDLDYVYTVEPLEVE